MERVTVLSAAKQCGEMLYLRACLERKITHDTNNLHALISDKVADLQTAYNLKSPFPVEFAQGRDEGREDIAVICQIVSWNDPWKSANNPTSKPSTEMKCSQTWCSSSKPRKRKINITSESANWATQLTGQYHRLKRRGRVMLWPEKIPRAAHNNSFKWKRDWSEYSLHCFKKWFHWVQNYRET